jgi:hypothetical protein
MSNNAPRINFMTYERQSQCTVHGPCRLGKTDCDYCLLENVDDGNDKDNAPINKKKAKIVNKKFPTLQCSKIGSFIHHVYLPILEKCRYHFSKMLSQLHCYNGRHAWYASELHFVKMHRDYADAIQQEKDKEIQSDHFGYVPAYSIEGVYVWSPIPSSVEEFEKGFIEKDAII